jgi:hypothetical protein
LTFWQPWKESILDSPRIIATRLSENDVSGECNVTFSTQISPVLNERQPSIDRNDGDMMLKKTMALIKDVFSKWMFILHKAQIIRYREVSMSYYILLQLQKQLHQTYFRRHMKYK